MPITFYYSMGRNLLKLTGPCFSSVQGVGQQAAGKILEETEQRAGIPAAGNGNNSN